MDFGNPVETIVPPNWRDDLSWPSGYVFHCECTNVYGYTLDKTHGES